MDFSIWAWAGFGVFILLMLALDLGVLNRKAHTVTYREAAIWSAVWVTLAMLFAAWVFWSSGSLAGKEFLAGYLIELSLSVDNLFVFLLLFSYFKVPAKYQHRVLYWGVLGALVMRAAMILAGAALISRFHWINYVFGAFLVYTGVKMFGGDEAQVGLAVVLTFVGLKMLAEEFVKPYVSEGTLILFSLGFVVVALACAFAASLL